MTWLETESESFVARHDDRDAADAEQVLHQLEAMLARLERQFGSALEGIRPFPVVLHGSEAQLDAAEPWLPLLRRRTAPAGRRYFVGWAGEDRLDVLAPRVLAKRASNVEGSIELLMLAPSALLVRRVVAEHNPGLPPPFGPRAFLRYQRWAWLIEGAAQHFSGQVAHLRPVIARRLHEGKPPSFPPSARDALLLGGSLFDLLVREEGKRAAVELACTSISLGPQRALEHAFHGRELRHTEGAWRSHLNRIASATEPPPRPRPPGARGSRRA